VVRLSFDKETYLILALRYKELSNIGSGIGATSDVPFEIDTYLTEIDTGLIDANYMNSRFKKFLKTLKQEGRDSEHLQAVLDELHKSFASLTQEEQKFANLFIHDVHNSLILEEPDKSFREYITEYQHRAKNDEIRQLTQALGVDEAKLRAMMHAAITEANINEYGRFNDLKNTVDPLKAKAYFERLEGKSIPAYQVKIKTQSLLQDFILKGGFEIESPGFSGDVDPS
jgi:type I restriction enzyme R subunit